MGQLQVRRIQLQLPEDEQIQIDATGAERDARGRAAELRLEGTQRLKELLRRELRQQSCDCVDEVWLLSQAPGLRAIKRRLGHEASTGQRRKRLQRPPHLQGRLLQ